jgi:predicted patatin/cPLA2 family phospholipase
LRSWKSWKGKESLHVYPDTMPVSSREVNYQKLQESYRMGYEQGKRDLIKWKEFLLK